MEIFFKEINIMRNLSALILGISILLISCNNQNVNESTMSYKENEKLVKQYFEHFNNHEWVKMANMYSETVDFKDPSLGVGIVNQTRQQITDKYTDLNKIFPDLHDKVLQTYPSGDSHIIVEFISSGTAADSSKFELAICTILTIENGLITKDYTYYDNYDEGGSH